MFNQYPYWNITDLNLDYILRKIKELSEKLTNFIKINTIKYANPIQWNITSQYEANTVVIDANSGIAYLSVTPVPSGVSITNTDYWTPIFTLNLLSANQNITLRDDGNGVLSTFSSIAGDWLIWGGVLYKVTQTINVNEAYVVGYNITRYTVELFVKDYVNALTNNINGVISTIGDLANLSTTDKTSVVNAMNELVTSIGTLTNSISALNNAIGTLSDLTTTDKTSVVNAINELVTSISYLWGAVGSLANLHTTDKSNLVNAINELVASINTGRFYLMIGDSYGDESGEWADLLKTKLGNQADVLCVSGASFGSTTPVYNFNTQIESYTGDRSKVTDIIVCGGLNDSISNDPLNAAYTTMQNYMIAFDTYVKANFPNATIHLGYIGNGNDYDPNSYIDVRTYEARQCCKYLYYTNAASLGWHILHDVEYCLTGSAANIAADGVHPSTYGSDALATGIYQALLTGSADYNYPLYTMPITGVNSTATADVKFQIHNGDFRCYINSLQLILDGSLSFTSGVPTKIASFGHIGVNAPIERLTVARLYSFTYNGNSVDVYVPVLITLNHTDMYMTVLAGTPAVDVYAGSAYSQIILSATTFNDNSMKLV